jgi:biopolymer transport protein ExbB
MFDLFKHAGMVAWPLGLFSVLALGIILERLFTLTRLRQLEERAFMMLQLALENEDDDMVRDANIAAAPCAQIMRNLTPLRGASQQAIEQAADISLGMQRLRLRRYLGTLATIGSTAPFVGLFGTVLGVMAAFQAMSKSGLSGETMAAGISEALAATALGLLVAIPAVMSYNYFVGRMQGLLLTIQGHVARLSPMIHNSARQTQEV